MTATHPQTWEMPLLDLADEAAHAPIDHRHLSASDTAMLREAYSRCDEVIAEHGKTFFIASRLLPPAKRRAIRALYAFCRVADDIVDCSEGTPEERAACLDDWRRRAVAGCPPSTDLVAAAWADTRQRYAITGTYCHQLIDAVANDLTPKEVRTFAELAAYAYGVASTVGLMSLYIIGTAPGYTIEDATPYAVRLGVALQITNILRDVGQDKRAGRIYLPTRELEEWNLTPEDLDRGVVDNRWRDFMGFQVRRNRRLYADAWPCIAMFHSEVRFAVAAACALYASILEDIEAHDYDVFNRRAHISTWGKLRRLPSIWWRNR
jgi:15-cis-phytoene synthase